MTTSTSFGYLHSMRYLVAVFQTASLGGELGGGGDFERADGVVRAAAELGVGEAPVGDVAMVADPVHELAAAGVVVPPPVLVEAAGVEGHHLRRAGPEVVIDARGHRAVGFVVAGAAEIGVAGGQADLDPRDLADVAVLHQFGGPAEVASLRCHEPVCQMRLFFGNGIDHGDAFGQGVRERFLAEDVLAGVGGGDGRDRVPVVGRGDAHGVDVVAGDQFAEILVALAVLVAVLRVDLLDGLLRCASSTSQTATTRQSARPRRRRGCRRPASRRRCSRW